MMHIPLFADVEGFIIKKIEGMGRPCQIRAEDCLGLILGWSLMQINDGTPVDFWHDHDSFFKVSSVWKVDCGQYFEEGPSRTYCPAYE